MEEIVKKIKELVEKIVEPLRPNKLIPVKIPVRVNPQDPRRPNKLN